jgi:geranylgeranyl diphosphate synthase type II
MECVTSVTNKWQGVKSFLPEAVKRIALLRLTGIHWLRITLWDIPRVHNNMFDIKNYLQEQGRRVEEALGRYMLAEEGDFSQHIETMRYSLFVGGKRLRPILCLAAAEAVSENPDLGELLLPTACALECIHTYSLIHDDLPAMDNDDLRRGQPTCHKKYGEAEAILAGDGLLTYAFELISSLAFPGPAPEIRLQLVALLAQAVGSLGMVGGQFLDISSEKQKISLAHLKTIHRSKTGALIRASVQMGALGGKASPEQMQSLSNYGQAIGLAFQIVDDLLDVTGSTEQLGKTAGSDADLGKATYPAFFGIEQTGILAQEAAEQALAALTPLDHRAEPLRALARYIVQRSH